MQTTEVLEAVFINSGDNPFELIQNSIKYVQFKISNVTIIQLCYLFLQFCHFEVANGELL